MTTLPMSDIRQGGTATAGFDVGIICLETRHALLPGNVQHARSFAFPVLYEAVAVDDPWEVMRGEPALLPSILAAARTLRRRGVRAICGACGSFGFYQREVAAAMDVPVFLSPLMLVPLILAGLAPDRRLGVVAGSAALIDQRLFDACGVADPARLAMAPMADCSEFANMVAGRPLDVARLRAQTRDVVDRLIRREPAVGAILLQCSDLPPFAADLQAATGLPVFDMTRMIAWVAGAAAYQPYC